MKALPDELVFQHSNVFKGMMKRIQISHVILLALIFFYKQGQIGCAGASSLSLCCRREMFTVNRRTTDLIDKASTASSAFFRYPANSINAMKYHTSRLHEIIYEKHSHLKL